MPARGHHVPPSSLMHLDRLLKAPKPPSSVDASNIAISEAAGLPNGAPPMSFDVADFVSEALDTLSLEQLRSFLLGRLDTTRSEASLLEIFYSTVVSSIDSLTMPS